MLSLILTTCALCIPIIATIPANGKSTTELARLSSQVALVLSIVLTGMCSYAFLQVGSSSGMQLTESYAWLANVSSFELGIDGLSGTMVLMTGILLPTFVVASRPIASQRNPRLYYALLFLLTLAVLGIFMCRDLLFFMVFWELELLPVYLLIAIWGGSHRTKAANKFLLFTFSGGALLLLGIISMFWLAGGESLSMSSVATKISAKLGGGAQPVYVQLFQIVFILCMLGFSIKLPSIPVHTWLPDVHKEAPAPISMYIAGVLDKVGAYGLLRFGGELFPDAISNFAQWLAALGAINIVLGGIYAIVQTDLKKMLAYSSVSHMGFVLLGMAAGTPAALGGAIFQMFSHGLISTGLFMVVGAIYERTQTHSIKDLGGLAQQMPKLFYLFIGLGMANLGLPAFSGFVGESLVFYGAFDGASSFGWIQLFTSIALLTLVITAGYMLWMSQRVFFGKLKERSPAIADLRLAESLVLGVLLISSLCLGCYPRILSDTLNNSAEQFSTSIKQNN